ncbi:MAG: DUF721 domain-containing protein [Legionellaceae bacterium]|nr:DUF721 domain-containing protein [Legionellaceae bacterium]
MLRRVNQCLNSNLVKICLRSYQLEKLQDMVRQVLPDSLREHCQVGSFQQGQLIILVNDACWATELKFLLPQLRDRLRSEYQLYQLSGIQLKVGLPPAVPESGRKKKSGLTRQARQLIDKEAEGLPPGPLQTALKKLAGYHREG